MPVINALAEGQQGGAEGAGIISGLAQTFRIPVVATHVTHVARSLLTARDKCDKGDASLCEKPVAASHIVLGVVVGSVVALVVITGSVLAFLHCRRSRRDARDDAAHAHELADYGMDPMPNIKKPRKAHHQPDIPIHDAEGLAPPARRLSSDSLSSLARSIRGQENPFGSGAELAQTDSGSQGGWKEEGGRKPADPFR